MARLLGQESGVELYRDGDSLYFLFAADSDVRALRVPFPCEDRKGVGRKTDLLKKALGAKTGVTLRVLDLTAGLLRDSLHFLQLGCQVTAVEENLLLSRAASELVKISRFPNFLFVEAEASRYLDDLTELPDVIFYDPMFVSAKRKSMPGKETQLLQKLCRPNDPQHEQQILEKAVTRTAGRVVVKRSSAAPWVGGIRPHRSIKAKAIRYDIYQ